jgi:hypothetical protein
LWPNRFALGKLGLIVGLPDVGKGSGRLLLTQFGVPEGSEIANGEDTRLNALLPGSLLCNREETPYGAAGKLSRAKLLLDHSSSGRQGR